MQFAKLFEARISSPSFGTHPILESPNEINNHLPKRRDKSEPDNAKSRCSILQLKPRFGSNET